MIAARVVRPRWMPGSEHLRPSWCASALAAALIVVPFLLGAAIGQSAEALNEHASQLVTAHRYADALPLYQRALALRESDLGPDHPDTAQALTSLAQLYWAQGQYAQALPLFQRTTGWMCWQSLACAPIRGQVSSVQREQHLNSVRS
jgi:tetratricopeptide (TPR) repeat protein